MVAKTTTRIKSVRGSADGRHIVMDFASADQDWRLEIPLTEVPKMMASMFGATREAYQNASAGQDVLTALPVFHLATKAIHSKTGKVFLEVSVEHKSPGFLFSLSRKRLVAFARGILEVTGHIALDPNRKLQ